ncbi:MAG: hypothetical protein F4117_09400 [Acidimicrobiales bacterium]|nr:hypothetical protein [Acidimicrobiaceae bacterium]MXV88110.1 hypothetical protein [Acidimicrobiales bacterium]MCY3608703.1 hypothetical protein [Acidimicrobiaceae bacterium]MDE0675968.1 hypothetical protein [Acidimicrobiaceae bacterium]MXX43950.1 hypothetical protein [Acidimicrobiales bacterium]
MADGNRDTGTGSSADGQRITPSDISDRVRQLVGGAGDAAEQVSSAAVAVAAAVGTGLVLAAFLFGRRRGRRRSTLVEVVRV